MSILSIDRIQNFDRKRQFSLKIIRSKEDSSINFLQVTFRRIERISEGILFDNCQLSEKTRAILHFLNILYLCVGCWYAFNSLKKYFKNESYKAFNKWRQWQNHTSITGSVRTFEKRHHKFPVQLFLSINVTGAISKKKKEKKERGKKEKKTESGVGSTSAHVYAVGQSVASTSGIYLRI